MVYGVTPISPCPNGSWHTVVDGPTEIVSLFVFLTCAVAFAAVDQVRPTSVRAAVHLRRSRSFRPAEHLDRGTVQEGGFRSSPHGAAVSPGQG